MHHTEPIPIRQARANQARARIIAAAGCLAVLALLAGCRVNVDKSANGKNKNVQIDTPFGGIHVNTGQTTAVDVGLPAYPGAQLVRGDNHKSADVHMGFGDWELRVRAVTYESPDSQDKILAFYKKALGSYGNVITCRNHEAIGSPAITAEGLSCAENKDHGSGYNVQTHHGNGSGNLELKAGSPRHQHIVSFDNPEHGQTRFALVWLDLPINPGSQSRQSD
jgi:hypothetical protein